MKIVKNRPLKTIHKLLNPPAYIVIDLFCGAGGTSKGFDRAKYKGWNIAEIIACVNHDSLAIRNHSLNFPNCIHFTEDISKLDLRTLKAIVRYYRKKYPSAKLILWASLECTHFSNAKTGSRNADSRTLAHILYKYQQALQPDLIQIENVREFMSWGPLIAKTVKRKDDIGEHCPITYDSKTGKFSGMLIPENRKKGTDYIKWKQTLEARGYRYSSRLLNSADYGSHQARLRYFGVFARPGLPVVFPEPTHDKKGRHGLPKWKPVREVLDLHEIGASIFNRKIPLSPNTLKRILAGLIKFVPYGDNAYIVKNYGGDPAGKVSSLDNPAPTVTTRPHEMLISASGFLCQYNGTPDNCNFPLDNPCRTLCTRDSFGLVSTWIDHANRNGEPTSVDRPANTIVTEPRQSVVSVFIDNQFGHGGDERGASSIDQPCGTLMTVPKKNLIHCAFLDRQFGNSKGASIEEPCGALATEPKTNLVSAEFLMPTNYDNEPTSLDDPASTITANRKWHYLIQPWILTNMHGNSGTGLDQPCPTLLTGTHHYLLNPQFKSAGGSINDPCFTLIAKMDKRPPSLVTIEPETEGYPIITYVHPDFFKDDEVDVETRIRVFMYVYGIRDIFMRMLNIPELKRIQGLNIKAEPGEEQEPDYILQGSKEKQKKYIGNAVEPRVVTAWIKAYHAEMFGLNAIPQLTLF